MFRRGQLKIRVIQQDLRSQFIIQFWTRSNFRGLSHYPNREKINTFSRSRRKVTRPFPLNQRSKVQKNPLHSHDLEIHNREPQMYRARILTREKTAFPLSLTEGLYIEGKVPGDMKIE